MASVNMINASPVIQEQKVFIEVQSQEKNLPVPEALFDNSS